MFLSQQVLNNGLIKSDIEMFIKIRDFCINVLCTEYTFPNKKQASKSKDRNVWN